MKIEEIIYVEGRGNVAITKLDGTGAFPKRGQYINVNGQNCMITDIEMFHTWNENVPKTVGLLIRGYKNE